MDGSMDCNLDCNKNKYCKDCKARKSCFCIVVQKYVPKKGSCEKFASKKG